MPRIRAQHQCHQHQTRARDISPHNHNTPAHVTVWRAPQSFNHENKPSNTIWCAEPVPRTPSQYRTNNKQSRTVLVIPYSVTRTPPPPPPLTTHLTDVVTKRWSDVRDGNKTIQYNKTNNNNHNTTFIRHRSGSGGGTEYIHPFKHNQQTTCEHDVARRTSPRDAALRRTKAVLKGHFLAKRCWLHRFTTHHVSLVHSE
jgi:hypothetical protein